jgi:glucose-1-phosphate adenylyltransferase
MRPTVLAMVLAGGQGSRLRPLTLERCKPAVPFEGHRLIDFVLSNLLNSGIEAVHVLAQYRSQSLFDHLVASWPCGATWHRQGATIVTAVTNGTAAFRGTADAVFQNIQLLERAQPDLVAVFGADHVYRMDVRQMIDFHRASGADATVATVPVPVQACSSFGLADADSRGRITRFHEKPATIRPMPGSRTHVLASMGNYIFDTGVLIAALRRMHAAGHTDFGTHVLPSMVGGHTLMAYDFARNKVAGAQSWEEPAYWRDVGTLDAYFESCIDTRGERPKFRISNPDWPIHGPTGSKPGAATHGRPRVAPDRVVILGDSRISPGALVRNAIIDQGNVVPCGERIGFDAARDRARFQVSAGGVVVVRAGYFWSPQQRAGNHIVQQDRRVSCSGDEPVLLFGHGGHAGPDRPKQQPAEARQLDPHRG